MEEIKDIIGFDPLDLPDNECNNRHSNLFKVRALFKLMLYVHSYLNFERMFDPDLNNHIRKYSPHTKQDEDYFPLDYDPEIYTKTRKANCGIYSNYFETLAKHAGFEARHVGLKDKDGRCGHWCSEVKVDNKWIFFDPMYLICSKHKDDQFHSAWEIMDDPINRYINSIPSILKGISQETFLKLWEGLEINKETTYELGESQFYEKYYG